MLKKQRFNTFLIIGLLAFPLIGSAFAEDVPSVTAGESLEKIEVKKEERKSKREAIKEKIEVKKEKRKTKKEAIKEERKSKREAIKEEFEVKKEKRKTKKGSRFEE